MRQVARDLAVRGITTTTFDFPYITAKRRLPDRAPVLEAAFRSAWLEALDLGSAGGAAPMAYFAGGKSMGGRIASQVAATQGFVPPAAGLVFFGYPLHPPGKPEQRRDAHLPSVHAPMLFVHGTRDPFGTADEFADLLDRLPGAQIHSVIGGDHSLKTPKASAPAVSPFDRALDGVAEWMHRICRELTDGSGSR
jgi:predicted alpha/beta-hydrolase family hydrolase